MDIIDHCPLPELAEALKPYVRSREEVRNIRSGIDTLLAENVKDDIPLSKATLAHTDVPKVGVNNPFTGVRRAFIKALVARQKAQAQYESLKAELGVLRNDKSHETNQEKNDEDNSVAETVSFIRQKQRQRKLVIIEQALDSLEKTRKSSTYANPTDILNGSTQNQAPPPLSQQGQDENLIAAQSHVFELQKAVLRAQGRLETKDYLKPISEQNFCEYTPSESSRRAFALRKARDGLIGWIEGELAKLSEDTIVDHGAGDDNPDEGESEPLEGTQPTLRDLYDTYVASREVLIGILNTTPKATSDTTATTTGKDIPDDSDKPNDTGLASTILPFIEALRSTSQDEMALLQHTSYIRRQLTAVSSDTDQLISRLSEESHMVRPGTCHASAWAEAAKEARAEDMKAIHSNLVQGERSAGGAKDILRSAEAES